jgi:hypothetical protein
MTRDWLFTITDPTKWSNLWNDLILPTISDSTFGNSPFVPSMVRSLKIQGQSAAGVITKAGNSKLGGVSIPGATEDVTSAMNNCIDLKNVNIKVDTNPTLVYVSVVA